MSRRKAVRQVNLREKLLRDLWPSEHGLKCSAFDSENFLTTSFQYNELVNEILLFAKRLHQLYKLAAEWRAWVQALTRIEKLDNLPHWLATNEPAKTNRALHLLLESITVSTETIELKFK